jgi:SAM-dependent methyltransferase
MGVHPLASSFAAVADRYERGRPDYRPAVVGALAAELGLAPGARVLDLAAGTGKLTRALRAAGFAAVAVEPQAELRELLAAQLPAAEVLDGVAEGIPLADASVDAVTVADAFHWFDHAAALAEIARVLRPSGGLAVLTTIPDWRGASWADEVGSLLAGLRPAHPHFDGPSWRDAVAADGGWSSPREVRITVESPADTEQVVDYVASISWVAALPDAEREDTLARVRSAVAGGETPPRLRVHTRIGIVERT